MPEKPMILPPVMEEIIRSCLSNIKFLRGIPLYKGSEI